MILDKIEPITIFSAKIASKKDLYIENDLILFDEVNELPLPAESRKMGCILLALCLKGHAEYIVDTDKLIVHPNDLVIINEGQLTEDYKLSEDCSGIAIMLSQDFLQEIIEGVNEISSLFLFSRTHPILSLQPEEVNAIINYFQLLKEKVQNKNHHFRKDTVRMLISSMIYDVSNAIYRIQHINIKRQSRGEIILAKFIYLVEQNFKSERRVSWYAQKLCITPKYLSEIIKQVSHRTPNEWIDYYVTRELKVLLKNSGKSIKEITLEMNFANQSFLGKFFKEHVGMSPTEYRRLH
ncbi:AraC-type DNA-binding protein [Segatella bryantii]|uniref:helix-turn-helix domain-containing protein n=1 Tax=Segatella bryantii TaxID=77095 RepID=UPI000896F102|nr:helix-turn-helix domain-containing protein [Segatella bryantii]SEA35268.1 AraC-type DNA-binding protein [Segatella bryantii]